MTSACPFLGQVMVGSIVDQAASWTHWSPFPEAALARDKAYVQKLLKEEQTPHCIALHRTAAFGKRQPQPKRLLVHSQCIHCIWVQNFPPVKGREKKEDRLAREQAIDEHWLSTQPALLLRKSEYCRLHDVA